MIFFEVLSKRQSELLEELQDIRKKQRILQSKECSSEVLGLKIFSLLMVSK